MRKIMMSDERERRKKERREEGKKKSVRMKHVSCQCQILSVLFSPPSCRPLGKKRDF